jgi:hypothetical protein
MLVFKWFESDSYWISNLDARTSLAWMPLVQGHWSGSSGTALGQIGGSLSLTPIAEEFNLIPNARSGHARAKTQDSAQLLSYRVPLLRRENHTGML